MLLLGLDIGSSYVKASLLDGGTGKVVASAISPAKEMPITSLKPGWAEQDPSMWWSNVVIAVRKCISLKGILASSIGAIGISYQMHGLVLVDKNYEVIRPSIIWCDSRAVNYGQKAFETIGADYCMRHLLNSPGNFTASRLAWVKENEPENYKKIFKFLLPGDYIAMMLTGEILTTISGLSEGIFWDFTHNSISDRLLNYFGIDSGIIPTAVPSFSQQGKLKKEVASDLGLKEGIPVSYRAGDQLNNAYSLNVMKPGEVAATAGTSGVIYALSGAHISEPRSRINAFAHVNHTQLSPRVGLLLCINGVGIANAWMRNLAGNDLSYTEIDAIAEHVPEGCDGLTFIPFGNGAERILSNRMTGAYLSEIDFNRHSRGHVFRAVFEGIVFSYMYGLEIMEHTGIDYGTIRAGMVNMFCSPVFRNIFATVTSERLLIQNTDGSIGAARGAGTGCGWFTSSAEAFAGLETVETVDPDTGAVDKYAEIYQKWKEKLHLHLKQSV
jgi:xylulokinase